MNKTNFYKHCIREILKADPEDMYCHIGDRNFETVIQNNLKESINEARNNLNNFFSKINIEYNISEEKMESLTSGCIKENYTGKPMICIHFEDIYEHLINNNVIEANNEISVYRIENKSYTGFYQHFNQKDESLTRKFNNSEENPEPARDGVLFIQYMNSEYREKSTENIFGFKDKEQLFKWINTEDEFIELLLNENLYLSEYKVKEKDLLVTNTQVAFSEKKSRLVKREPIDPILKDVLSKKNEVVDFLDNKQNSKLEKKSKNKYN